MSDNILFDNFIITDDKEVADNYAADSWELKHFQELSGGGSGVSVNSNTALLRAILAMTVIRGKGGG